MRTAEKFMKRHKYDDDRKFHAIEKWEINSESENPDEVWEYERTRVDQPKRWVKLEELKGKFWIWKSRGNYSLGQTARRPR